MNFSRITLSLHSTTSRERGMNARKARMLRNAAGYRPGREPAKYGKPELQRVDQMPTFEKYTRTIREIGPVSPGAPTNERKVCVGYSKSGTHPWVRHDAWVPRSGARAVVVSREVEKIRYKPDGKTPYKQVFNTRKDEATGLVVIEPVYELIPVWKPVRLEPKSPKGLYRHLKKLERTVGLDRLFAKLLAESQVYDMREAA